jgi:nucleolin
VLVTTRLQPPRNRIDPMARKPSEDGGDDGEVASSVDWSGSITSVLENAAEEERKVKKVRKMVLLSLQMDDGDKGAKKRFKAAIQTMEQTGALKLDGDGTIHLLRTATTGSGNSSGKKKRKASLPNDEKKKSKKGKKQTKEEADNRLEKERNVHPDDENDDGERPLVQMEEADDDGDGGVESSTLTDGDDEGKNRPCRGNPQGVTRLFLGNLPFAVDEASLGSFLPGRVTHIKWITDKETGKFYGSAFCEMDNSKSAAAAVAMSGSKLIGRPIKINLAPAGDGDVWPPPKKVTSGNGSSGGSGGSGSGTGGGGQAGGSGIKAMSAKPDNCTKLFIGNLSYDIDDETISKFFASVDAEVKAVRWLHHRDSGDFKGVGFVEFWNSEACEHAAALNGKNLLGRPIRIDWTD